jgi:hypothetical protein
MTRWNMNQRNNVGSKRSKWGAALALFWVAACGGVVGGPNVGGESHFLLHCGDGCGPGLECVADVCTRACRIESGDCTDLSKGAKCTNDSIEPGSLAVCDVACESSTECESLGVGFTCDSGFCRGPIPVEPGSGGGSAGSTSGGSNSGGSASGGSGSGPEVPAARCLQPFDVGPCKASAHVYAFEDGACVPKTYGGCQGNDNRFYTLEECLSACEGRPSIAPCPEGRVAQRICIACGPAGGCAEQQVLCAQPCDELAPDPCEWSLVCFQGVCQAGGCE